MTEWKPEKNISSPWDVDVWENNIGQPVKPSGANLPYPYTTSTLKIGPSGYKLDPKKLAKAPQYITPYLFLGAFYYTEDYEYFDVIKPYLDIPEKPKTLDEIQQEFDEKIDKLIETTKWKFSYSKQCAEDKYNRKFDRINQDFEYAKEHGKFMPKVAIGTLFGSYLVSNGGGTGLSAGPYVENSFVIKQGNNHKGYYTIGNQRYFRYYMPDKPNAIVRFFMKTCLGFVWVDEKNG